MVSQRRRLGLMGAVRCTLRHRRPRRSASAAVPTRLTVATALRKCGLKRRTAASAGPLMNLSETDGVRPPRGPRADGETAPEATLTGRHAEKSADHRDHSCVQRRYAVESLQCDIKWNRSFRKPQTLWYINRGISTQRGDTSPQ